MLFKPPPQDAWTPGGRRRSLLGRPAGGALRLRQPQAASGRAGAGPESRCSSSRPPRMRGHPVAAGEACLAVRPAEPFACVSRRLLRAELAQARRAGALQAAPPGCVDTRWPQAKPAWPSGRRSRQEAKLKHRKTGTTFPSSGASPFVAPARRPRPSPWSRGSAYRWGPRGGRTSRRAAALRVSIAGRARRSGGA